MINDDKNKVNIILTLDQNIIKPIIVNNDEKQQHLFSGTNDIDNSVDFYGRKNRRLKRICFSSQQQLFIISQLPDFNKKVSY